MNRKMLYSVLALGLLVPAGPALAGHPANDPGVGYNVEALDQAHAAYVAAHPQEHAFAPGGGLPTRADFTTQSLGVHPVYPAPPRPWLVQTLKESGRFRLELQRMDDAWLTLGVGK